MIASVKNRAAIVTDVLDDGTFGESVLHTFDPQIVGARQSDGAPLGQVVLRGLKGKRHRPVPRETEHRKDPKVRRRRASPNWGGQVIRPSVLKAMEDLREHVERQFPS